MANNEIFEKYPKVDYRGYLLTNLVTRVAPVKGLIDRIELFYPYVIKDGERADTIAYDYYGSEEWTWLIYVINEIFDPYYQWPMTSTEIFDYLTNKYGDYYTTKTEIHHYKWLGIGGQNDFDNEFIDYTITPFTYSQYTTLQKSGWYPVTTFEYEDELNENRRNIKLLSNDYLNVVQEQVKDLYP